MKNGPSNSKPRGAPRLSVAMAATTDAELQQHLLRRDGQEDVCLALYSPANGSERQSALLHRVVLPLPGDRAVHGNASFTGDYILRASTEAAREGYGLAILHSHPRGIGWQELSAEDRDAEASYANLVREVTGLPLVGLTLAGISRSWSARFWDVGVGGAVASRACESVRVVGEQLRISWNDRLRDPPRSTGSQLRTVSCWGPKIQADMARLRVLIVGVGSVGLDVALRLAASGVEHIGIMDFDSVKPLNLDRLVGASPIDAWLRRSKVGVARRLIRSAATAARFTAAGYEGSVTEPAMLAAALDYDIIFCCVDDRPWPRSILNTIAYADLIPVVDGGVHVDAFPDESGMRNATWRAHVLRPGRPCMSCNGQLDLGKVHADRDGMLEDPVYIAGLAPADRPTSQNVAMLAVGATFGLLAQYTSLVVAPGGQGEPGPQRFVQSIHRLEPVLATSSPHCPVESQTAVGDDRLVVTGDNPSVGREAAVRDQQWRQYRERLAAWLAERLLGWLTERARTQLATDDSSRG